MIIPRKVVKSIVDIEFLKTNSLGPGIAVEDVNNGFMISVGSGAKGNLFNVCRMTRLLGQQYINGKRLTDRIPQGTIFDQRFVVESFGSGLSPKESFSRGPEKRHFLALH